MHEADVTWWLRISPFYHFHKAYLKSTNLPTWQCGKVGQLSPANRAFDLRCPTTRLQQSAFSTKEKCWSLPHGVAAFTQLWTTGQTSITFEANLRQRSLMQQVLPNTAFTLIFYHGNYLLENSIEILKFRSMVLYQLNISLQYLLQFSGENCHGFCLWWLLS